MNAEKVNIAQKLALFDEHWSPKVVGELNGQHVKLVKLLGEFVWHHHEDEDELFLVVQGRFRMEFRDRSEWIEEGEFVVVPRGGRAPAGRRGGSERDVVRACFYGEYGERGWRVDESGVGEDLGPGR